MSYENDDSTMSLGDYVIRVHETPLAIPAKDWNALLSAQSHPTPFMRHEYLAALHQSGSATPDTGWTRRYLTLHDMMGKLEAACPLYLKSHSRGEYVFDWSWADAHHRHGLAYYPKGVVAVPFTPAPGTRLLARDDQARQALIAALIAQSREWNLSSLHLLFGSKEDLDACEQAGLMLRQTVQFHWANRNFSNFDEFLSALTQEKRKKIRQERRKVREAGVTLRALHGAEITPADWDFFYRCYEHTYYEHSNPPYLNREFFELLAAQQPQHWLLFIAERDGRPIASSLIALDDQAAWGRYWGALERVDCLHFEACYYAPIEWCIAHGIHRFEGGAQGEHKLARALLPVTTPSAHWLAHPDFARAIQNFLDREGAYVADYVDELERHAPMRMTFPDITSDTDSRGP